MNPNPNSNEALSLSKCRKGMDGNTSPPPFRPMNFVSQQQLEEAKRTRGQRVDDGTAERNKPLFEILKENKDKQDAEFNERFKHRPPKALDEDETEFLDKLEMSRREYERQVANEEAQQLQSFQEAVAAHSSIVYELKEKPAPKVEEHEPIGKKNRQVPLGGMIISVKPQAKKAKTDAASSDKSLQTVKLPSDSNKFEEGTMVKEPGDINKSQEVTNAMIGSLVSYSDESEDD